MTADLLGALTDDQRAELRKRAIQRARMRRFGTVGPRGPRPPDGGEPMPVARAS